MNLITTRTFSIENRRRCTMIRATILLCYLFTCCTHLTQLTLAAGSDSQQQQQQQHDLSHRRPSTGDQSRLGSLQAQPVALGIEAAGSGNEHKHKQAAEQPIINQQLSGEAPLTSGDWTDKIKLEDLKHDNVHKIMSEQDLRRTFQVDSHDQVPEYEILKLTVNPDGSHLISPISDLGELTTPITTTTTTTSSTIPSTTTTTKTTTARQIPHNDHLMKVSTFGKVFHLRLKRNADFQQRIKDMKMFMAESTQDGQLRYTEIKSHHNNNNQPHQHHHHKQEPHKRAAGSTAPDEADNATANIEPSSPSVTPPIKLQSADVGGNQPNKAAKPQTATQEATSASAKREEDSAKERDQVVKDKDKTKADHISSSSAANVWNIGLTYHDEDNLAALLIDHDRKTGQLQVDGTIGNDFVIKPMPQATIDALVARQQQQLMRSQQRMEEQALAANNSSLRSAGANNNALAEASRKAVDLERGASGADGAQVQVSAGSAAQAGTSEPASLEQAMHLHDDDPHDDDEMFLDEDEAIELAHLQSSASIESNHTTGRVAANAASNPQQSADGAQLPQQPQPQPQPQQPRTLSKAASERKWRKYRKLMAQTQVPKPAALAGQSEERPASVQKQEAARARRHAAAAAAAHTNQAPEPRQVQVSHHIVYRQKPSSEGSSANHQHSFMIAPGSAASMEQMAMNFSPQRLAKRSAEQPGEPELESADENMIDGRLMSGAGRLARQLDAGTDFAHDPLGGQFYLEPGSVTGAERAGYSDWSLLSSAHLDPAGRRAHLAPPPYALNASDEGAYYSQQQQLADRLNANSSSSNFNLTGQHHESASRRRFKRQTRLAGGQVRRKRQAPDTVWPEVLLVVDYDSFLLHGGDSREVKRYFVSFWNGVDLRYKLLVHPHIRISLAGMIVAKDRDATPYLERNRLRAPNADAVDAAGALTDMGKYLYREDRLPTYDLAVVITKLDMCRRRYEGGRCNRGTAGFAYVGGACVVNKRLEKVNSVAIIEDSGGFSGIIVAAHEVGHLLGCVHDGSPPPSYLGGPGATHCPWEDGFIMSDLRHTERGFRWSQCSIEQFKHFLNGETATCLYNYPHESQMLHRLLPGTMLSLDEQCKHDRGTNACFKDARVCAQLFCFDSASGYCVSYRPAAEGSPCGEGQVCRNGKCVIGEIENIIPDYTHQSQTVVARRPHSVTSRLADNGSSASSTSTATSSPDSKLPSVATANQLTSRMDTFPIDTPLSGPSGAGGMGFTATGSTNYPFGGRHGGASGSNTDGPSSSGLMLMRQTGGSSTTVSANGSQQPYTTLKSGKLIANGHRQHHNNNKQQAYQQRSGHQAISKGANQGVAKQYHQQSNNNHNNHPHSSTGLYTSASTMSHQYPPSSPSGNNLLTSVSTNSVTLAKKQQQPFDNQRIMYQPMNKHSESHSHISNSNQQQQNRVNRQNVNVNYPSIYHLNAHASSTSSSKLYNPLSQTTTVTS